MKDSKSNHNLTAWLSDLNDRTQTELYWLKELFKNSTFSDINAKSKTPRINNHYPVIIVSAEFYIKLANHYKARKKIVNNMKRIAEQSNNVFVHQSLMSEFNNFIMDLKMSISDNTGIPSTISSIKYLFGKIVLALSDYPNPAKTMHAIGYDLSNANLKHKGVVKDVIGFRDTILSNLRAYKCCQFSIKEIDEFKSYVDRALETYTESIVKR